MDNSKMYFQRLWFAIALNFIILVFLCVVFYPQYDTNDDFGICNIVNGSKGNIDAHIIYSNYVLGLIYKALYSLTISVPWYPMMHYAAMFSGFTALTYTLLNKLKQSQAVWIIAGFLLFFGYEGYILMQFTRTSGIATAGGLMLMFWALCNDNSASRRTKTLQTIAGGVIALMGYMFREGQFIAVAGVMSAIGVMILLELPQRQKGQRAKQLGLIFCAFVFLFGIAGGLKAVDKQAYASAEWQEYRDYNNARSALYDHGFPSYSGYEDEYEELGINENAKNYYRQWNHIDLSAEQMRKIASWNESDYIIINSHYVARFIRTMAKGYLAKPVFFLFLAIVLLWILRGKKNLITITGIVYTATVVIGLNFYMFMMERYLKDRVDVGIIMAACLVILWTLRSDRPLLTHKAGAIILALVILASQFCWHDNWRVNAADRIAKMENKRVVAETMAKDKEHLYLNKAVGFSYSDAYGAFDTIPYGISENVFTLGGWTAGMPSNQEKLDRYGIKNVYTDSINNGKVYIIDKDIDTTIQYIRDYYDAGAKAEKVFDIGDYPVYRLTDK